MKKSILFVFAFLMITTVYSQKTPNTWYYYNMSDSRPEGYDVRKVTISDKTFDDQNASTPGFSESSHLIIKVINKNNESRFITKDANGFNALVLKNITSKNVRTEFITSKKTEKSAISAKTNDRNMSEWFTGEGFKEQEAKPTLNEMTREEVFSMVSFMEELMSGLEKKGQIKNQHDRDMAMFGIALTAPDQWLKMKGFNEYKSLQAFSKGMNSFKEDPEFKQRMGKLTGKKQ